MSNVPNIRFKGFSDPWKQRKLGELTIYRNGTGHEEKQSDTGKYELVNLNSISIDGGLKPSGKFIDEETETLCINDLVMVLSDVGHGDLLGRVAIIPENNRFVLNQRVALLRGNGIVDVKYLFAYINAHQRYFKLQGAGSSQLNISRGSVENFDVLLPKKDEQNMIGLYFANLDNLITLHQRKCDETKELKKYMLQKLFPKKDCNVPEIRFNGFTDAWEQRKFNNIFTFLSNNSLSRAELSNETNELMDIHYGDILINYNEMLDIKKDNIPYVINSKKININGETFLKNGDIVIADAAEDSTVGKCVEIKGLTNEKLLSGLHTIPCSTYEKFGSGYLGFYLNSNSFHDQLLPLMQGAKVSSISKSSLKETYVQYPASLKEQQLIGMCFENINNLITLHQRKCEELKEMKKYMLSNMFPKGE